MGQKLGKQFLFMFAVIVNKTVRIEEAVSKSKGHPIAKTYSNRGK